MSRKKLDRMVEKYRQRLLRGAVTKSEKVKADVQGGVGRGT